MQGATFRPVDLHIHTPASSDFRDRSASASAIVQAALDAGLELIAITDHNSAEMLLEVRKAAQRTALVVLPGVEISTQNGHLLALFDVDTKKSVIDDVLTRCGIPTESRGKEEALGKDIATVINEVVTAGGLAVAAHANTKKIGLLGVAPGQLKTRIVRSRELAALEFTSLEDHRKFTRGTLPDYGRKACIQGSDAHALEEIGRRRTLLKMDTLSLEGVRQALLNYRSRVQLPGQVVTHAYPRLIGLSVSRGFLAGQQLAFHPHLTCLIGGRGVGKSTVVELLRFAFDNASTFADLRKDMYMKAEKLVGIGGSVQVDVEAVDGSVFSIVRTIDNPEAPPSVTNADGEQVPMPFRPLFFSQGELARVGASESAQLELIDSDLPPNSYDADETAAIADLELNRVALLNAEDEIASLQVQLDHPTSGKRAVQARIATLRKAIDKPVLRDYPRWTKEEEVVGEARDALSQLKEELREAIADVDVSTPLAIDIPADAPNKAQLKKLAKSLAELRMTIEGKTGELIAAVASAEKGVKQTLHILKPKYDAKRKEYQKAIENEGGDLPRLQQELVRFEQRQTALDKTSKQAARAASNQRRLAAERATARVRLQDVREKRFKARKAVLDEWNRQLGDVIDAGLDPSGELSQYCTELQDVLNGSRITDLDIKTVAATVEPAFLAELLEGDTQDAAEVLDAMGLRKQLATRLVEWLASRRSDVLALESVRLPDLPKLQLVFDDGTRKPLQECSVGQKSTVLLLIAMQHGSEPLVVDQPEDSLDPVFIHNRVARIVLERKVTRQFLFTTHNPSLLVGADADLNVVLEASAKKSSVKSAGGLDRRETKELIIINLEGGRPAFRGRQELYGRGAEE